MSNKAKLSHIIKPTYDPLTGGAFKACHWDLKISRERDGDEIIETTQWRRDLGGEFVNRNERKFSISKIESMINEVSEGRVELEVDIPEGSSKVA